MSSKCVFCFIISDTILTNVIQAQYCTAVLGRSQADCQEFYEPKLTVPVPVPQNDTETFTATFLMLRTLIEAGMPSLVAFFVGPWSDKFGRKPLIAASAFGIFYNIFSNERGEPNGRI